MTEATKHLARSIESGHWAGQQAIQSSNAKPPHFRFLSGEILTWVQDGSAKQISFAMVCEKIKAAAEEAAELLESTYAAAASATTEYHLKIIEVGRANLNYWLRARPRTHKGRFGTMTEQANDLAKLAPGVVMRTAEPAQFRVAAACKLFD